VDAVSVFLKIKLWVYAPPKQQDVGVRPPYPEEEESEWQGARLPLRNKTKIPTSTALETA
jgi:hypothetical protein